MTTTYYEHCGFFGFFKKEIDSSEFESDNAAFWDGKCRSKTGCGFGTTLDATDKCVPDAAVVCGTGTTLDATGKCVSNVTADTVCGVGTTVGAAGRCVPEAAVVGGAGTALDTTGQCVSNVTTDTVECGTGTTFVEGKCVSNLTEDTACGAGTTFMGGQCVSNLTEDTVCGTGTTFVEGKCVSNLTEGTVCGAGTTFMGGQCVSNLTEDTVCGADTTFVEGKCVSVMEDELRRVEQQCAKQREKNEYEYEKLKDGYKQQYEKLLQSKTRCKSVRCGAQTVLRNGECVLANKSIRGPTPPYDFHGAGPTEDRDRVAPNPARPAPSYIVNDLLRIYSRRDNRKMRKWEKTSLKNCFERGVKMVLTDERLNPEDNLVESLIYDNPGGNILQACSAQPSRRISPLSEADLRMAEQMLQKRGGGRDDTAFT